MAFDLPTFIRESNIIDVQLDLSGNVVPGANPGDPMYDRQLAAFELLEYFAEQEQVPDHLVLSIHRELTRGIDFFERTDHSGVYRKVNAWVGGHFAPPSHRLHSLIEELLIPKVRNIISHKSMTDDAAQVEAEWIHDFFECIHPFLDGNGRTGRLLMNYVLLALGKEPVIVYSKDKEAYIDRIQYFRDHYFLPYVREHGYNPEDD